jgi:hypothetical protein
MPYTSTCTAYQNCAAQTDPFVQAMLSACDGYPVLGMINGWVGQSYGAALPATSTTPNANGIVQLRGGMATSGSNQTPFAVPTNSIPSSAVYVPVDLFAGAFGRLFIDTAGNVIVMDEGAGFLNAPWFTSLENVSYAVNTNGFTPLTLLNGWQNAPYNTRNAAVINDNGTIRFQGAVANGTSSILFTLPAAFRPPTDVYIPIGLLYAQ